MLPQAVETKLLYETLSSPLIEETLRVTKRNIGEWSRGKSYRNSEDHWVNLYHNVGIPVTFEFTFHPDGIIEKTRERATFIWEQAFETPHSSWFENAQDSSTADWLDGIMFRSVLPCDFIFGIAGQRPPHFEVIHRLPEIVCHFQPARIAWSPRDHSDTYDHPLEIDHVFSNMNTHMDVAEVMRMDNYWRFGGHYDPVVKCLTELGFHHNKLWIKPTHHKSLTETLGNQYRY